MSGAPTRPGRVLLSRFNQSPLSKENVLVQNKNSGLVIGKAVNPLFPLIVYVRPGRGALYCVSYPYGNIVYFHITELERGRKNVNGAYASKQKIIADVYKRFILLRS